MKALETADGARLVWHDWGTGGGAGPVLVALHAHTGTGAQFRPLAAALPGWRVIAPDRRGYGGSTRGRAYDAVTQAEDLAQVLEACGTGRALVLGLAAGGACAGAFAARWPERVAALVLACSFLGQPAGFWGGEPPGGTPEERELSPAFRAAPAAGEWRAQVAANRAQGAGEPPQPCPLALSDLAALPRLHLWTGALDRLFTPAMLAQAGRLLPGARTAILPGVAHAAPVEDPAGFAARLQGVSRG